MRNNDEYRKKTISGLFWKFGERITAQLTSTIITIVLARLLMPEDYGAVAIVTVFITVCNAMVVDGLGSSLVQKKDSSDVDFSSVFYFSVAISIIIYFVLFLVAPFIAQYYEMPILTPVLRVMGIRLILSAINSVQHAFVSRTMQFKKFFWSTLFGTVLSGFVGIILAYHGFGIWALVFQYLTNTTVDTIFLFITLKWYPKLLFSWERLKALLKFGWKITVASLFNELYQSLRTLIIGKVYSASDLSFYTKGQTYPNLIAVNVNSSITSVLFPAIANVQDDVERVKGMLRRSIKTSSYFIFPMLMGFSMIAKEFVHLLLTDKWLPCVIYMQIFCWALCLSPLATANLQATKALGRSDLTMKQEIIKKTVGFLIIIVTSQITIMAIVLGMVVMECWCFVVNMWPNKKLMDYSIGSQIKDILPNLIISLIMAVAVYSVGFIPIHDIAKMFMKIIVGGGVYLILSIVTKNETFLYCRDTIFHHRKA